LLPLQSILNQTIQRFDSPCCLTHTLYEGMVMSMEDDDNDDETEMVVMGFAKTIVFFLFTMVLLSAIAKASITFF
jgi:hypothetical protein